MEHWDAITAERIALADQLEGLHEQQWSTPSLCAEWTVKDVAAHLVAPLTPNVLARFGLAMVVARGNFDRANVALAARESRRPTGELVDDLRRYATSRFKPPGFGSEAPLTDVLVHGADIRTPLGLPDDRPTGGWRVVLDLLMSPKARRGFVSRPIPGLRYTATDLDWTHGEGDEVSGSAASLALTLLRRAGWLDDLAGPGVPTIRQWARA